MNKAEKALQLLESIESNIDKLIEFDQYGDNKWGGYDSGSRNDEFHDYDDDPVGVARDKAADKAPVLRGPDGRRIYSPDDKSPEAEEYRAGLRKKQRARRGY